MLYRFTVPPDHHRGPQFLQPVFQTLSQLDLQGETLTLFLDSQQETVGLSLLIPPALQANVLPLLQNQFPDSRLEPVSSNQPEMSFVETRLLGISPSILPLAEEAEFHDRSRNLTGDPLAGLLQAVQSDADLRKEIRFQVSPLLSWEQRQLEQQYQRTRQRFLSRPDENRLVPVWSRMGQRFSLSFPFWLPPGRHQSMSPICEDFLNRLQRKLQQPLFACRVQLTVRSPTPLNPEQSRAAFAQLAAAFHPFYPDQKFPRETFPSTRRNQRRKRCFITPRELALLWHPPTESVQIEKLGRVHFRELEPPIQLPAAGSGVMLGITRFRQTGKPVVIPNADLLRHLMILGKTGMGKSTLLLQILHSVVQRGNGVMLLDPHGDLAESALQLIPSARTNDVLYFDAGDNLNSVSFNPLDCTSENAQQRALRASGILTVFRKLFQLEQAPRLEHILRHCLLTLVEVPCSTLLDIAPLLTDKRFRNQCLQQVSDPLVRAFWTEEYERWSERYRMEAIPAVLNKTSVFSGNPLVRQIIGESRNRLHLRQLMDDGKILIANLSKGRAGHEASALLGSLLVTSLELATMSRASLPETERRTFTVLIDEFQNFTSPSFADLLSEARKFGLSLVLANQFLDQIDELTRAAVFGNVGTLISFQAGATDARLLAEQLGENRVRPQDLISLPRFTACVQLLLDGMPQPAFTMRTRSPDTLPFDPQRAETVKRVSRERYGGMADSRSTNEQDFLAGSAADGIMAA